MIKKFINLILVTVLFGCSDVELEKGLSKISSLDLASYLINSGINAKRVVEGSGKKESYKILVPSSSYNAAVQLLQASNISATSNASPVDLLESGDPIFLSETSEKLKMDLVLAADLDIQIKQFVGVLSVKSSVRYYSIDNKLYKPSATVLIRYSGSKDSQINIEEINRVVINSLPGIKIEDIFINTIRLTQE